MSVGGGSWRDDETDDEMGHQATRRAERHRSCAARRRSAASVGVAVFLVALIVPARIDARSAGGDSSGGPGVAEAGHRYSDPAPVGPLPEPPHPAVGPASQWADATTATDSLLGAVAPDHASGSLTESGVLSLHSRRGATKTIFLDVDGHTTSGQAWNGDGVPDPLRTGAYSREPGGAEDESFDRRELDGIMDIWARIAEDYSAWEVDVTTEDPGVEALRRTSTTDERYGVRVVITHDSAWFGPFGGSAYTSSFDLAVDQPVFVFSDNLAAGNPKAVAEAASHEVGHTFGLHHDGHGDDPYYEGHGEWAPIMGAPYYREITQWSRGDYPGATNTEDDLALIDRYLVRRDTTGDEALTATSGAVRSSAHLAVAVGGSTVRRTLDLGAPSLVTIEPVVRQPNLHADVTVWTDGAVVASSTGSIAEGWGLQVALGPGSHVIDVRSRGSEQPDTAFSAYGAIGGFRVDVEQLEFAASPTAAAHPIQPMSPVRVLDTRTTDDVPIGAGRTVEFDVSAHSAIDDGATAAAVNVAAVRPVGDGWVTLTPCDRGDPLAATSSLNFSAGGATANASIVPLSSRGTICAASSVDTHLVVDVTAIVTPRGSVGLVARDAERVADSRIGHGVARRLRPGRTVVVDLAGSVESTTVAVAVNVTAIRPAADGFVTVDDCRDPDGTAAINVKAGRTRGNHGIFRLDDDRRLCVTSSVATDLTIDVGGEFRPGGRSFLPAAPTRAFDTRDGGWKLSGGGRTRSSVRGPASSVAASLNLTSVGHGPDGFVTAWDCGERPWVSALNPVPGEATASGALVTLDAAAGLCLRHDRGGHLIVDLTGWWV